MIGNAADAATALSHDRKGYWDFLFSHDGTSRTVYIINDVLYKVENLPDTNMQEYDFITNMRDSLPSDVHFPETSLFEIDGEFVTATQKIDGQLKAECFCAYSGDVCDATCLADDELRHISDYLPDSGGMNVIKNESGYWIIDAG